MIRRIATLMGGVAVVFFLSSCTQEAPKEQGNLVTTSSKSQVVAKVNGVPIYREEFENTLQHARAAHIRADGNLEEPVGRAHVERKPITAPRPLQQGPCISLRYRPHRAHNDVRRRGPRIAGPHSR